MRIKTFLKSHPSIKGRIVELIDNPFSLIHETQIDKQKIKEVIKKFETEWKKGNPLSPNELKKELRID